MDAVEVTDFPIRDHKVILVLRRRRWLDYAYRQEFSLFLYRLILQPPALVIPKSSELFLKETYGDIPSDLPYA